MIGSALRPLVVAAILFTPSLVSISALAQTATDTAAQPAAAPAAELLKPEQLDQLVAPIALYPDTLLAQVLMASTYPLEVVQADRWVTANKALKPEPMKTAAEKQGWDESVKSLVATPSVLTTMSTQLEWTKKLGDAVLAQQPDVMDAVQRLRVKAQANKKLSSTKEQTVRVQQLNNKPVVVIEQTSPDTVYVPYYDPAVVYGAWPYPAYMPYYWPYPGYIAGGIIATGIAFGAGYALGRWASGGNYWGGNVNWNNNNITIGGGNNRPGNIAGGGANRPGGGGNWQHRPEHRHGVKYGNSDVAKKFGNNAVRDGAAGRNDFRGRDGQQVLRPNNDRPGDRPGGDRPGGDRPGGGDRVGDRPGADRPGGGAGDRKPSAKTADRKGGGNKAASRPGGGTSGAAHRPASRDNAFGGVSSGRAAGAHGDRGRASMAHHGGGGARMAGGGGGHAAMGGGGRGGGGGGMARGGGGGGGRGGGGGGRRSDEAIKYDIALLGRLSNGIGIYRFVYIGSDQRYVGVMAQEVQAVNPDAVTRGSDGYLRVRYDKVGVKFQSYERWLATGAHVPEVSPALRVVH